VDLPSLRGKSVFNLFSRQTKKLKEIQRQRQLDKHLVSSLNAAKLPTLKQLKYLPKILTPAEKKRAQWLLVLIIVCLTALSFQLFSWLTVPLPKAGGEYVEGLIGSPAFINPALTQSDSDKDLSRLIFSGLLRYDKNRQLVPDLATDYQVSDDQLTYTINLKKDVKWHDGADFKSDDVVFTVTSLQDPDFKSPLYRSFRGLRVEKIDDYSLKFILPEPFAPFLGLLTFGILPEHLWYNIPPANADLTELNKKPIGTGPWKFENFKKDKLGGIKSYTLAKNPNYYGDKSYLERLIFKFYGDHVSAVEALKNKEVQGIAYLPTEYRAELKKYKNLNYRDLDQPQYTAIFFNQRKNELLQAAYLRQALALATNKQKIVSEAFGQAGRLINEPSLPGIEPATDLKKYDYDPQQAVAILEKNGWSITSTSTADGLTRQVRQKKGYYLEINLTAVDQPISAKTAEIIKQSWEQIGAMVNLKIVDKSKILSEVIKTREYETLLFSENIGSDPDPFPFWHSSQRDYPGLNLALFSHKEADKLLEEARQTNNWDQRKTDYLKFQKIIADELPAIFLYNPTYTYPQDKNIKGFDLTSIAAPADRLANLNEWYVKTKRIWKK